MICAERPGERVGELQREFLGIPDPGAGFAVTAFGLMLHLLVARPDEVDAVQQGSMHGVNGFVHEIVKLIQATEPVAFLPHFTTATAFARRIKAPVRRAILECHLFHYEQARIR